MGSAASAGEDLEIGKMSACVFEKPQRPLFVVERNDEELGLACAGGFEQLGSSGIAIVDFESEPSKKIDVFGILLNDGGGDLLGP